MERPAHPFRWLFDSAGGPPNRLLPRWLFLRALAAIYFSAFFALLFQIDGLNGPRGILPAGEYLSALAQALGPSRFAHFWNAPSLFWISSSSHTLFVVVWLGLLASVAALFNLWPRLTFFICLVCFLSFVTAASDFSGYQSDGMLLEAGFLALFFAPPGLRPGWGATHPPSRASLFLLQWEWFRIYFESGLVKLLSGDPSWHNLSAMDDYYQNSPLPTWIGWYANHLPHWFHQASAAATLLLELIIVLLLFLPRRARLVCFLIVTPWEIAVILTGNYAFLNYLVLSLGILLLDDNILRRFLPSRFLPAVEPAQIRVAKASQGSGLESAADPELHPLPSDPPPLPRPAWRNLLRSARLAVAAVALTWIGYATTVELLNMILPNFPLPAAPVHALEPFRIANQYGLFAVMTHGRYEIEFQGSNDGQTWTPYAFRFKPQVLNERPGLYAPYQPRFDWNLWFASLGSWQQNDIVPLTQERLLENDPAVLRLFRANPFPQAPPRFIRSVLYQYWVTSMDEKRRTGNWWRRQLLGQYSPTITRAPGGHFTAIDVPTELPPHG